MAHKVDYYKKPAPIHSDVFANSSITAVETLSSLKYAENIPYVGAHNDIRDGGTAKARVQG